MASPLGVGVQTLWSGGRPDFDPRFRRVEGGLAVVHSCARRCVCPPGQLPWAPSIGFDVRQLLNEGLTPSRVRMVGAYLRGQCLADDRVQDAVVTSVLEQNRARIRIEITTSDGATFALVLGASKLTIEVLAIEKV